MKHHTGYIEVVCGSMFSGKTEELIRRLKRVKIANQSVAIFKPALDTRYDKQQIVSHDTNAIDSKPVESARTILELVGNAEVIGIDEAQFFDDQIPDVCDELAKRGIRVIVAGLDMDYLGKPFGQMPSLLAKADFVTKLHAICDSQGRPIDLFVTAGQVSDYIGAAAPLGGLPKAEWLLADRGYDADELYALFVTQRLKN